MIREGESLMTIVPMIIGYILARKIFKIDVLNSLGSICGGMTSTPALGALISTAKTDDVSASYAATYPIALVMVVLAAKIILMVSFFSRSFSHMSLTESSSENVRIGRVISLRVRSKLSSAIFSRTV